MTLTLPLVRCCSACGSPNPRRARFCSGCGAACTPTERSVPPASRAGCPRCGATLALGDTTRAITCPFCDTPCVLALAPAVTGREAPAFVLPFAIDRDEAAARFASWVASGWFQPGDLGARRILTSLTGVYVPYWHASARTKSVFRCEIGEHWERVEAESEPGPRGPPVVRTRTVVETEWFPLQGSWLGDHPDVLVPAGRALTGAEAAELGGFELAGLEPYDPRLLAGWSAEEAVLDRSEGERRARAAVLEQARDELAAALPGDDRRGLAIEGALERRGLELTLLPLFVATYRYRERTFRFLVHGVGGRVVGERPLSWWRVLAAFAAVLVLAALAWWYGRGGTP